MTIADPQTPKEYLKRGLKRVQRRRVKHTMHNTKDGVVGFCMMASITSNDDGHIPRQTKEANAALDLLTEAAARANPDLGLCQFNNAHEDDAVFAVYADAIKKA